MNNDENEFNDNGDYGGFTQTPKEITPAVEDDSAKKQLVSSDSDPRYTANSNPPNTWNDYHRKQINKGWGENIDRANWGTFDSIVCVRACMKTSHHNQNEVTDELCKQALEYFDIFYKEATLAQAGDVYRKVEGVNCFAGYSILPEHVFNEKTDPSYEASIRVRGHAKKRGNKDKPIEGYALWARYKQILSVVQGTILPIEKDVLPNNNAGSGCNLVDKVHGLIRKRYFESDASKKRIEHTWETWTDAYFECYRVFGILGEKKGLFMRQPTSKQAVQPAKHPTSKEIAQEKFRKYEEKNKSKQSEANDFAQKAQALMGETVKVKQRATRTARFEAKRGHLKEVLDDLKWQIRTFPDAAEELKKQYREKFQEFKDLKPEDTPQQSELTTAHRSGTTLGTKRTSADSNGGDEEGSSPLRAQKLFGSERKDKPAEERT